MSNAINLVLLVVTGTVAVAFVAISLRKGAFQRYLYMNLYAACIVLCDAMRQMFLHSYGFKSKQYFYSYYVSDLFLAVLLYLAIVGVLDILLRDSSLRSVARISFGFFFALVMALSYGFISHSGSHFFGRWVVEFEQNMYFARVVLTVLLFVALSHLRVADPQLRMVVCGVGVSGALQASFWAMQNLVPHDHFSQLREVTSRMGPLATIALLTLWCYAVLRFPVFEHMLAQQDAFRAGPARDPAFVLALAGAAEAHG